MLVSKRILFYCNARVNLRRQCYGSGHNLTLSICTLASFKVCARQILKPISQIITIIFIALTTTACEANMIKGLFTTKKDVVLFSKVQGQILHKGIPVKQAKVIRRYTYDTPEPVEDSTITDDQGYFELPLIERKNETVNGLSQFVVYQEMYVLYENNEIEIWGYGKLGKEINAEYGGDFKKIVCELSNEPIRKDLGFNGYVYTNCTW
jgi:hypothetical protein